MAILTFDSNLNAVGIIEFPIDTSLAIPNAQVKVTDLIKNDLLILFITSPLPYKDYLITWRLGLQSSGLSGGSIFRGPLPKYDLGTVVFTNGGAVVSEERWNWSSQVFSNFLTQHSFSSEDFPDIPAICEGAEPTYANLFTRITSTTKDCSDNFYICNDGQTVVSNLNAWISYQAAFIGSNSSFYSQTFTGTAGLAIY